MILKIILKLFLNRELYLKYIACISLASIKEQMKEVYKLFTSLEVYYNGGGKSLSCNEFELVFFTQYPALKPKEKEIFELLFEQMDTLEAKEELVVDYLETLRQDQLLTEIALTALEVKDKKKDISALEEQFKLITRVVIPTEEEIFITDDLEELHNEIFKEKGLRWRLGALNRMLGSLRRADFGFLFARPESGKTTFLASEVTYMAGQTDRPIIWFNNEEAGNKVKLRCYQAALGMTLPELFSDLELNKERYMAVTKGNIKIYDAGSIHRKDVDQVCAQLNPVLIIFDQLDKIKGWQGTERHDLVMKEVYQWARELAKEYGSVIGVCQAGGSGEGKKRLTMDDVDSSKTAKQGEADWILGIGKSSSEDDEYVRYLHLSKNKLMGDIDSDPEARHGTQSVIIMPEVARYKDIIK
jgi:replicative DNA helicase